MISRRTLIRTAPAALAGALALPRFASPAYAEAPAQLAGDTWLVDRYGQYLHQDWPGKVVSDEQLRSEYAEEAARLADVAPDRIRYDRYGGLKELGRHKSTGYFRLEQVDGRWWFVTPDGHLFILKAVDAFSPRSGATAPGGRVRTAPSSTSSRNCRTRWSSRPVTPRTTRGTS